MENLVDMARAALKGDTVARMSSALHESEGGIRQGFEEAVPVSIAGLANQATTEDSARAMLDSFKSGRYPHVDPGEFGRTVADPSATDRVLNASAPFLGQAFGGKLDNIVDGLAGDSGLRRTSASKLLGLAAPLVMGMVGKMALARNLDPRGLLGFLGEQRRFAAGALPAGLAGMLAPATGHVDWVSRDTHPSRMVEVPHHTVARRSLWPWMLAGLAVLLGLVAWSASRRRDRVATVEQAPVTEPAPRVAEPPARPAEPAPAAPAPAPAPAAESLSAGTGMSAFAAAIDGTEPLPKRFELSGLEFQTGSANIEPTSANILDEIAETLKAKPSARIRVEGHTDATGSAGANAELSMARANSVKNYLVDRGVTADRIETVGLGEQQPTAANVAAEGRALNRRTELVLIQR